MTALHVTHNLSEAQQLADRLLVLRGGQVEEAPLRPTDNGAARPIRAGEVDA